MTNKRDPDSTRCTFVIPSPEQRLFQFGSPGDRIEMYEERNGHKTGFVLTARILGVSRVPVDPPPPGPTVVVSLNRKV